MYDQQSIRRYQEADITSMGREKIIALLYEKMISCYQRAEEALESNDHPTATGRINLAQQIVTELRNALDHEIGGEISLNLDSLYDFIFHENLKFLVDREAEHLHNCVRVLRPLAEAWRQIEPGTAEKAAREREGAIGGPKPASSSSEDNGSGETAAGGPEATDPETVETLSHPAEQRMLHPQLSLSA